MRPDKVYLWGDAASDTYLICWFNWQPPYGGKQRHVRTGTTIPVHRRLQWHLSYEWIFIIPRFAYYRGSIAYVAEFICRLCNSITDIVYLLRQHCMGIFVTDAPVKLIVFDLSDVWRLPWDYSENWFNCSPSFSIKIAQKTFANKYRRFCL